MEHGDVVLAGTLRQHVQHRAIRGDRHVDRIAHVGHRRAGIRGIVDTIDLGIDRIRLDPAIVQARRGVAEVRSQRGNTGGGARGHPAAGGVHMPAIGRQHHRLPGAGLRAGHQRIARFTLQVLVQITRNRRTGRARPLYVLQHRGHDIAHLYIESVVRALIGHGDRVAVLLAGIGEFQTIVLVHRQGIDRAHAGTRNGGLLTTARQAQLGDVLDLGTGILGHRNRETYRGACAGHQIQQQVTVFDAATARRGAAEAGLRRHHRRRRRGGFAGPGGETEIEIGGAAGDGVVQQHRLRGVAGAVVARDDLIGQYRRGAGIVAPGQALAQAEVALRGLADRDIGLHHRRAGCGGGTGFGVQRNVAGATRVEHAGDGVFHTATGLQVGGHRQRVGIHRRGGLGQTTGTGGVAAGVAESAALVIHRAGHESGYRATLREREVALDQGTRQMGVAGIADHHLEAVQGTGNRGASPHAAGADGRRRRRDHVHRHAVAGVGANQGDRRAITRTRGAGRKCNGRGVSDIGRGADLRHVDARQQFAAGAGTQ